MSSLTHSLPKPSVLTSGQLAQMREHLAHHYAYHYRPHVTYHELREAGQQVLTAAASTAMGIGDPRRVATMIYQQMKAAIVHVGQSSQQRSA